MSTIQVLNPVCFLHHIPRMECQNLPPKNSIPPAPIREFVAALERQEPRVRVKLERGGPSADNWWIDVSNGAKRRVTVEWRPELAFGIFNPDTDVAYGEGPSEIFRSIDRAAKRVLYLLENTATFERAPWLRQLREVREVSQSELADRMHIEQGSISKLENRRDLKVTTLVSAVRALGGRVKVMAYFDDCDMPLPLPGVGHSIGRK